MQQKPIKNTTPPIMSPSQHQHGVMMTLRSLQPNPSPWLDHSPQLVTQFPHHTTRWRLHSFNRSATTAVWRRPRLIWHPHAAEEQRSGSENKKIYLKYEKIWKKYGIFGHPGKELTTPRARIAAGSVCLICCRGTLIYVGLDHGQSCSIRTILFTQVEPIVYMKLRVEPLGWRDHKTPQQSNSWPFVKNKTIHSISLVEFWSEIVSLRSYVVICSSKNQIRISIYQ